MMCCLKRSWDETIIKPSVCFGKSMESDPLIYGSADLVLPVT